MSQKLLKLPCALSGCRSLLNSELKDPQTPYTILVWFCKLILIKTSAGSAVLCCLEVPGCASSWLSAAASEPSTESLPSVEFAGEVDELDDPEDEIQEIKFEKWFDWINWSKELLDSSEFFLKWMGHCSSSSLSVKTALKHCRSESVIGVSRTSRCWRKKRQN